MHVTDKGRAAELEPGARRTAGGALFAGWWQVVWRCRAAAQARDV